MDRRIARTRSQILEAFTSLLLSRPYDEVTITEVVDAADIARSTFYSHFRDKRGLLLESMSGLLDVVAACATGRAERDSVGRVVEHLWENRVLARTVLNSRARRHASDRLAEMIHDRSGTPTLTSTAISHAYLGALCRWLCGDIPATRHEVAHWLLDESKFTLVETSR